MSEQRIENYICEVLTGEAQENVLDFVEHLRANEMLFERGRYYWENKLYWIVKYKDESVCFILLNGSGIEEKFAPLTIWSDDSGSNWFEDSSIEISDNIKKIVWENVDICGNCGSCGNPGGSSKTIFGKEFDNVCITTMRFVNPDAEALECLKKMAELRKRDILRGKN